MTSHVIGKKKSTNSLSGDTYMSNENKADWKYAVQLPATDWQALVHFVTGDLHNMEQGDPTAEQLRRILDEIGKAGGKSQMQCYKQGTNRKAKLTPATRDTLREGVRRDMGNISHGCHQRYRKALIARGLVDSWDKSSITPAGFALLKGKCLCLITRQFNPDEWKNTDGTCSSCGRPRNTN